MDENIKEKRLYIVRNLINGKVYGGKHYWHPNTKYMGSGYALKKAFSKYGKENFSIRWLKLKIKSSEHLDQLEIRMIRLLKHIFGNKCYNIQKGGCGGYFIYYMNDDQKQEVFKKISDGKKRQYANGETQKQIEGRKKMREKRIAHYKDPVMKAIYDKSQSKRVESLKNRRAVKGATEKELNRSKNLIKYSQKITTYKIVFPCGKEIVETKTISEFMDTYKAEYNIFIDARRNGKFVFKRRTSMTKHPFPPNTELYIINEIRGCDV